MSSSLNPRGSTNKAEAQTFQLDSGQSITLQKGLIKLPNGKAYKVKLTNRSGSKFLDPSHSDLTQMIVSLLNESQQEAGFSYKDLSKTKITHMGIKTDQASRVSPIKKKRVIETKTYSENYREISALAASVFAKQPAPILPSAAPVPASSTDLEQDSDVVKEPTGKPKDEGVSATVSESPPPYQDSDVKDVREEERDPSNVEDHSEITFEATPLLGRVDSQGTEQKPLKKKAQEALQAVGEAFKKAGGKIKQGWQYVSDLAKQKFAGNKDSLSDSEIAVTFEPLDGRVKPLKERAKETALAALAAVGNGFKTVGSKVKQGFMFISQKTSKLFQREKSGADPSSEGLLAAFEEVEQDAGSANIQWMQVPLVHIDKILAQSVMSRRKPVISEGELQLGKRGFHVKQSQVGTSHESENIMRGIVGKMQEVVFIAHATDLTGKVSREFIEEMTDQLDIVESILKSVQESDWAQGVLAHYPSLQADLERVKEWHAQSKADYLQVQKGKEWKQLTQEQVNLTLFTPGEAGFRKKYLRNYRMYKTTEELFGELTHIFNATEQLIKQIEPMEPNEEGKVTFPLGGQQVTDYKKETLAHFRTMQKGILLVCKEWLEDPFVNNGEHKVEGAGIIPAVGALAWKAHEAGIIDTDALREMEAIVKGEQSAPHVEAGSLVAKHSISDEGYEGYTDKLIALATGKLSKGKRQELVEQMAEDLFKRDAYLLSQITSREFVGQRWGKDDKATVSPNITRMITTFNAIANFAQFSFIGMTAVSKEQPDTQLTRRKQLLKFFIDLADKSLEKGNFNTAMAIYSAFSNAQVSRLSKTFDELGKGSQDKLANLRRVFDRSKNNKNYKAALKAASEQEGPYIPYLGHILKEYTFADDGNPTTTEEKLNSVKLDMLDGILGVLLDAQRRIAKKAEDVEQEDGTPFFETDSDLTGEVDAYFENASQTLAKVAHARGDESFQEPMAAMLDRFLKGDNINDILYEQSLNIQPRKKS